MSSEQDELARRWALAASAAFADQARYIRTVPESEWDGPTGCEKWDFRYLAGHAAGEAVWFPNLVRGATRGEPPIPQARYDELYHASGDEIAAAIDDTASGISASIEEASSDELQLPVDLGFMKMPVCQAVLISLGEGIYHHWDMRAKREDHPTIPTEWALAFVLGAPGYASAVAHRDGAQAAPGIYLLEVGDGVGPITIIAEGGTTTVTPGPATNPAVTVRLTADQYVRLIAGRFRLRPALDRHEISVEGSVEQATGLNRIFAGVGGG